MADVIILGAGLTGVCAAYHLDRLGISYNIFEQHERAGGLLRSVQEQGYTFDYTGHLLHISDPAFKAFLDTIAGLTAFELVQRKSGVYSNNIHTEYPFQMNLFGLPTNVIAECIEGYIKRHTHIRKPTNFHQWVMKYFGAGMGKHFFFPYNSKLLHYDLKKVHPSWTGRFVPSTNLQAIIAGAIAPQERVGVGYNSAFYYPKAGGIEFIIKKIVAQLAQPITTNHTVERIDAVNKKVYFTNGHSENYQQIISTLPLTHLLRMTQSSANTQLHNAANKLLCNSVININLGLDIPLTIDKHWLYFPDPQLPFYRLGFWHNLSARATPVGHSGVYGELSYLPGSTSPAALQGTIAQAVTKTLAFLNVERQHKIVEKVLHLEHAYVIYDGWRERHLPQLLAHMSTLGIHSTGRYGAWKYSSMQEAFQDGMQAATHVAQNVHLIPNHQEKGVARGRGSSTVLP